MAYPTLEIAGNKLVFSAGAKLAKLNVFAHDYANSPAEAGAIIDVPVVATEAGIFNEESNNYGGQAGTVETAKINVDKHLVAGFTVTTKQLSDGLGAWNDTFARLGEASGKAIAKKVEAEVVGLVTSALDNTSPAPATKTQFIDLWKVCAEKDLDPSDCVLVLNPATYAKMLDAVHGTVDNMQGAIETGVIDNFLGFKRVMSSNGVEASVQGFIAGSNGIGIANRNIDIDAEAYSSVQQFQDADTGIAATLLVYTDPANGKKHISCTTLFGTGIINKKEIVPLVGA